MWRRWEILRRCAPQDDGMGGVLRMTFPSPRYCEAVAEESDKEIQGKDILRSAEAFLRMTRNRVPQDGGMGGVLRDDFSLCHSEHA